MLNLAKFECLSDENCEETKSARELIGYDYLKLFKERYTTPLFPGSASVRDHFLKNGILKSLYKQESETTYLFALLNPLLPLATKSFIYIANNLTGYVLNNIEYFYFQHSLHFTNVRTYCTYLTRQNYSRTSHYEWATNNSIE